jgi:hypothetical protein
MRLPPEPSPWRTTVMPTLTRVALAVLAAFVILTVASCLQRSIQRRAFLSPTSIEIIGPVPAALRAHG